MARFADHVGVGSDARRPYGVLNGNCTTCGGDPRHLGPPLRIVYWDMQIHEYGAVGCRDSMFLQCPWCTALRVRLVERGDGNGMEQRWPCPACYPMPTEQRAELILRRSGGESPWRPGQ